MVSNDNRKVFHCAMLLLVFRDLRNVFYYICILYWEMRWKDPKIDKMYAFADQILFLVLKVCPEYVM